jgi:hypothetical protein
MHRLMDYTDLLLSDALRLRTVFTGLGGFRTYAGEPGRSLCCLNRSRRTNRARTLAVIRGYRESRVDSGMGRDAPSGTAIGLAPVREPSTSAKIPPLE